jgi:redox-sensitive bicupin YhaK (pirin superfamily)
MIEVRPSNERGAFDHGWLDTKHSFSFADYYDPQHMGFGPLRVINEDRIQPAQGFGTHGHKDMEIITYIISGALEHKDSMGNGSVIRRNDVQRMTAGTGILHSEFNHLDDELTHLLQIWLLPETGGLQPGWEEKAFGEQDKRNRLRLIASRDARDGSLLIHRDTDVYASLLDAGRELSHRFAAGRCGWLQLIGGALTINGQALTAGDGAAISDVETLDISAGDDAEFLLFDMR